MLRFTQHLCVLCLFLSLTHYNYDCNAKNHSGSIKNRYFHELTDVKYVESLNSMKNLFDNNIYANLKLSDSNTSCAEDIITILLGVYQRERWALQWLDATTHPPPGIEGGAMHWTGSYDGCLKCSGGGGGGKMKFHGSYCTMVFNVTTTIKIIPELRMSFGLCMPDSCTSEEVRNMINKVAVSHPSIKMNTKESFCHRYVSEVPKDTWYYVAVSICSIITILVVIATSIDMLLYIKWYRIRLSNRRITGTNHQSERSSFENMNHIEEQTRPLLESDDITFTDHEGEIVDHTEEKHFKTFYQYRKSVLEKHILVKITCAYSLPANTMKLCSQTMGHDQSNKTTPISLTFLDGIRFVSMIWIIGAHILLHGYKLTNNLLILSDDFERIWLFGMYFNGHLAPDIFFFISGLLMCYICMGRLSNLIGVKNHIKFWFKAIVHRFVRLTPAYIVTVIVFTGLLIHMYDGPFFPQDINSPEIASCRQNWYLLYLSNIFNYQTSCLQWSWYIANDLQYTIILAPIFIILLRWKRITGIIFAIAIILMSIFITYYTAYTLSLQITK
ncbi:unnamed protein product [Schistosoma turkestanicum]|nr:unnamed protein product [Schistosoma turkestanicum]